MVREGVVGRLGCWVAEGEGEKFTTDSSVCLTCIFGFVCKVYVLVGVVSGDLL